jgi:hypothetical protein
MESQIISAERSRAISQYEMAVRRYREIGDLLLHAQPAWDLATEWIKLAAYFEDQGASVLAFHQKAADLRQQVHEADARLRKAGDAYLGGPKLFAPTSDLSRALTRIEGITINLEGPYTNFDSPSYRAKLSGEIEQSAENARDSWEKLLHAAITEQIAIHQILEDVDERARA